MAPIAALGLVAIAAGLVEAGVLTLLANVAASMVTRDRYVTISIGPLQAFLSVQTAIVVTLCLTFVQFLLKLVVAWLPTRIAANVQAELRQQLFDAFTRARWPIKASEREGHFQELMTNQINQATGAVLNLALVISSGAMFLALVASAFSLSVVVAGLVLASALIMFFAFRPLDKAGRSAAKRASQAYVDQAGGISESVRLAEETEVFGVLDSYRRKMIVLISASRRAFFHATMTGRLIGTIYQSAVFFIIVGGIGALYLAHSKDLGSLGAVILILVRASSYGQSLQNANHSIIQVLPYLDRLFGAIDRYRSSARSDGGIPVPPISTISFDHVSFAYRPGNLVLDDVSFEVAAGETIGIIGPTGAGKSTVAQILLGLRDPDRGSYNVNELPASSLARSSWAQHIAYVSQDPRLFTGSVGDNIAFFRDIPFAQIETVARLANIHDEIMTMPAGYDTIIGQQADAVSGGQRQRLCLARALAGEPTILLLDEPTSSLDLASEAVVDASLAGLHGRMTIFIIAHRLSVLKICDRVMVLEDGTVKSFASARELALTDAFYRRVTALSTR
jgi:ABC-type multidrug transport system fused ATPase/permease subunit